VEEVEGCGSFWTSILLCWLAFSIAGGGAVFGYIGGQQLAKRPVRKPSVHGLLMAAGVGVLIFGLVYWCLAILVPLDPYTRDIPAVQDIVGTWTPKEHSLHRLERAGRHTISTHTLVFNDDVPFEMNNLPEWWRPFDGRSPWRRPLVSGTGTWDIGRDASGTWVVGIRFEELAGSRTDVGLSLMVWGRNAPYLMHSQLGVWGEPETIWFERQ
jgi:hypothetical protein